MAVTTAGAARSAAVGARHADAHPPAGRKLRGRLTHTGRAARLGGGGLTELHASIRHLGADVSPVAWTSLVLVPPPGRNARGGAVHTDDHAGEALPAAARRALGTGKWLREPAIDRRHAHRHR